MAIGYRTEAAYGSGVRDLASILSFEVCELGNVDMVGDIVEAGYADMNALGFDPDDPDEGIGKALVNEIRRTTGRPMAYGLWLADREMVESLYDGTDADIEAYEESDVCLVNLGPDGRLYAYEQLPQPVAE